MRWTFNHRCGNGERIDFRVFDLDDSLVWPADTSMHYFQDPGTSGYVDLACTIGANICWGGQQVSHGLTWGVGIDGRGACTNCCYHCAAMSVATDMTCP